MMITTLRSTLLWVVLLLSACASRAPPPEQASSGRPARRITQPPDQPLQTGDRDLIVMSAFAQVGKPYQYGGNGPDAFDCSGLVRYAYRIGGTQTPRTTATLFASGRAIALQQAQPGDLLFYALDPNRSAPSHVVFYLGDNEGIHAPSSGSPIRAVRLSIPYFSQRFVGARRLLQ